MNDDEKAILDGSVDLKSDRLNDAVALFMGCTLTETMWTVLISFSIAVVIALLPTWILTGHFTLGLAGALVMTAPTFLILLKKLSRLKRGKPAGYYQHYLKIQLARKGIIKNPYVMRSGKWSTAREKR